MTGPRYRRIAWVVAASALSLTSLGCAQLPSLLASILPVLNGQVPGGPGPVGPQGTPNDPLEEMRVLGRALFPDRGDPRKFVPIAGARVDILDLPSGNVLGSGQADHSGRFEIRIRVRTRPADTVVGIRAKATRSAAYRISAEATFEILGLGGSGEAEVDPASTVAAAKIFEEAKARGTAVKIRLDAFREVVAKVAEALTPEDITRATTGGAAAAARLFRELASKDPALGNLIDEIFLPESATSTPAPSPSRTPALTTPTPDRSEAPEIEPTDAPEPDATRFPLDFSTLDLPARIELGVRSDEEGDELLPSEIDLIEMAPEEIRHLLHEVEWWSMDDAVAYFDQPGHLVAGGEGETRIKLKHGEQEAYIDVVVKGGGAAAAEVK